MEGGEKMLVLSRKVGQTIRINQDITLMVVEVDGKNVKLGIHAPRDVSIHREEVYQRINPSLQKSEKKTNLAEKQKAWG